MSPQTSKPANLCFAGFFLPDGDNDGSATTLFVSNTKLLRTYSPLQAVDSARLHGTTCIETP